MYRRALAKMTDLFEANFEMLPGQRATSQAQVILSYDPVNALLQVATATPDSTEQADIHDEYDAAVALIAEALRPEEPTPGSEWAEVLQNFSLTSIANVAATLLISKTLERIGGKGKKVYQALIGRRSPIDSVPGTADAGSVFDMKAPTFSDGLSATQAGRQPLIGLCAISTLAEMAPVAVADAINEAGEDLASELRRLGVKDPVKIGAAASSAVTLLVQRISPTPLP